MDFWYEFTKGIPWLYTKFCVKGFEIQGRENIVSGPKILVANHPNATDGFFLPFIVQEKVYFFIQETVFQIPFFGTLLRLSDQIPVSAGKGRRAIKQACEKLSQGYTVAIFPEGRLNHGGEILRGGIGAALLAQESGAPLVPVGFYVPGQFTRMIRLRREGWVSSGRWQLGGRCYIQVGKARNLERLNHRERNYRNLREVTEDIMEAIRNLVQSAEESLHQGLEKTLKMEN
jgi:1-acyl-sn-glycerol-3-phosphate acyltransferase